MTYISKVARNTTPNEIQRFSVCAECVNIVHRIDYKGDTLALRSQLVPAVPHVAKNVSKRLLHKGHELKSDINHLGDGDERPKTCGITITIKCHNHLIKYHSPSCYLGTLPAQRKTVTT